MSPDSKPNIEQKQSYYQLLSLDILIGALAVGLFAIRIFNVRANPVWWGVLPLAVWTVYTLDHLIDGYKRKGESTIYRHYFHYKNRNILIPSIAVSSTVAVVLSFLFFEKQILVYGSFLSGFVVLYFLLVYFHEKLKIKYIHKEVFIAFVYVTGIVLAPFTWFNRPLHFEYIFIFGILLSLVWAESVIVSFYDYNKDKADRLASFSIVYGLKKTRTTLIVIHSALTVSLFVSLFFCNNKVMLGAIIILSVMNLILLGLIYYPDAFANNNLFRWIGESVFILPAFIVFF
jgi:4-hydroxybenzoate polyprenyltransferase